jgi:hypothetical protein
MTDVTRPKPPLAGLLFVALMLAAGVALAVLFKAQPALGQTIPGLMWLLGVALVFDVALNVMSMQGRAAGPLPMAWRFGGFFAGAILHLATVSLLG